MWEQITRPGNSSALAEGLYQSATGGAENMSATGADGMLASRRGKEKVMIAVTNTRFASLHGLPVAPLPFDDARSTSQTARSSRACIAQNPRPWRASVCGSAAGVALRLRCAKRSSPPSAPLPPLADHRPKHALTLITGFKNIVPTAAERDPQPHQSGQARKVFPSFHALNIPGAHTHCFSQFFLSKTSACPQCGYIFSEFCSVRTGFGLARRHSQILSKSVSLKHEALHRARWDYVFLSMILLSQCPRASLRVSTWRTRTSRARLTSRANSNSGGSAVRYSRTNILLCKPSSA